MRVKDWILICALLFETDYTRDSDTIARYGLSSEIVSNPDIDTLWLAIAIEITRVL
jgi:hypothetical protein